MHSAPSVSYPVGRSRFLGALLLALWTGGAGVAGLWSRAPGGHELADPPRGRLFRDAHWVEPKLVCEIEFTEWTRDGKLRHPSYKGLRADKPARQIVREVPEPAPGEGRRR